MAVKYYIECTDLMVDTDPDYYAVLCQKIGVPDVYGSTQQFLKAYPFDTDDANSILSNLYRAYDNAIVMRDYIGVDKNIRKCLTNSLNRCIVFCINYINDFDVKQRRFSSGTTPGKSAFFLYSFLINGLKPFY